MFSAEINQCGNNGIICSVGIQRQVRGQQKQYFKWTEHYARMFTDSKQQFVVSTWTSQDLFGRAGGQRGCLLLQ